MKNIYDIFNNSFIHVSDSKVINVFKLSMYVKNSIV